MYNPLLDRKSSIILATVDVIEELGFQGLSIREVAKRVGISEPAILRHFKTKNLLILTVIDYFSKYDSDIVQSVEVKKMKPIEALVYFIDTFAAYYENYPAITSIVQSFDLLRIDPFFSDKVKNIYINRFNFISNKIKQAQKNREINPDIKSENLALIIMGLNRECCLNWRMHKYSYSLRKQIISALQMLLDAFKI